MSIRTRLFGPPAPKMPPGLIELMDGLARDVLKNNPENIYEFCAQHMHKLLTMRDGCAPKPLITLDRKIAKAQEKVKQRAEQRQRQYDANITQQKLPPSTVPCCSDDSENVEKKETVSSADIDADKEELIPPPVQNIEKAIELNTDEININANDNEVIDDTEVNEQIKEDKDHEKVSENVITESLEEEKLTMKDECNCNTEVTKIVDNIEDNLSEEVQSIPASADVTEANICESFPDETLTDVKINDNTEEKNVFLNECDGANLANNDTTKIENDNESKTHDEIECEVNESRDEMKSTDIIDEIIDATQAESHSDINEAKYEKQDPTMNDAINEDCAESNLNNVTLMKVIENQEDHLNIINKSQDDKILAVILNSEMNEPTSQNNETSSDSVNVLQYPESIQNNEVDHKTGENIDPVGPESTLDKSHHGNSSMDLETAAITIQKVFRSFLFKSKTASYDDPTTVDINLLTQDKEQEENEVLLNVKDRRTLGRMDTVLQTVNEEKSLSLSTDDSSTLSSAATVIQAHVRGFLVRNKLNLNKTISSNSLIDSDAPSIPSLDADSDNRKSKTVLNIHIVPEGGHFVSRDESVLTSMDLSLDSSPPSSVNLHPLGYDKSERRKQLKREDAIQSVSPPSNNSGKLSEEHDSVKEVLTVDNPMERLVNEKDSVQGLGGKASQVEEEVITNIDPDNKNAASDVATDEMDVVTPFADDRSSRESNNSSKLLHSGEFHDIVVPTDVTRSDTSVVREFQNVLVYFILWNN